MEGFFFFFPRLHNGDGGETNGGVSQVGGRRNCCWEMTDLQKKGGIPIRALSGEEKLELAGRQIRADVLMGADSEFASSSSSRKTAAFYLFSHL